MKRLVRNTAINFAAFGLVSLISLALVPLLIAAYGLEFFGLIVLARLLLPTGIMGLFDLGLPNSATRHIAHASARGAARTGSRDPCRASWSSGCSGRRR